MKFIDLQEQYRRYQADIDAAMKAVVDHGQFILGPEVAELEAQLAEYVGVKHCVGAASGTTALQMALMALDLQPGDEVITPAFSFFATAEVPLLLGVKPVYVDINPKTYNVDPVLIEAAITEKTKAIMPVSLYGQPADFDAINAIAERYSLPVIEDAAQSIGAMYHGRRSGALSTLACTSFFPSKPLGGFGDGGACFTNDDVLAEKLRLILNHGQSVRYHHTMIGINGRLDTIQAAVLKVKLSHLQEEMDLRQAVASVYARCLSDEFTLPYVQEGVTSAYAQYTIQVDQRDTVRAALSEKGIPTAVHYPKGLHQQPASAVDLPCDLPVTEAASARVMSLPFYPFMPDVDVERVAAALRSLVGMRVRV